MMKLQLSSVIFYQLPENLYKVFVRTGATWSGWSWRLAHAPNPIPGWISTQAHFSLGLGGLVGLLGLTYGDDFIEKIMSID